jgi:all-trans-nonaprenyl-diphosphate synthase
MILNQQVGAWVEGILDKFQRGWIQPELFTKDSSLNIIDEELDQMKINISKWIGNDHPVLQLVSEYYFLQPGKNFRPMVMMMLSKALSGSNNEVQPKQLQIAEIVEMIHTASIIHDDVIDDATARRGAPSINIKYSNKMAILAGDYLLAQASVSLSQLESFEVTRLISKVIAHLVKGEFMQMSPSPTQGQTEALEYYLKKTYYKTASLISNGCRAAAILGNHTPQEVEIATEYGNHLGLAFQVHFSTV